MMLYEMWVLYDQIDELKCECGLEGTLGVV